MILIGKLSLEEPNMLKAVSCFSFFWSEERSFNLKFHFLLKTFKKRDNNFNDPCKLEVVHMQVFASLLTVRIARSAAPLVS